MALRAGALTTYAAVKAALGLEDDSQRTAVERAIDAASAAITRYCAREWEEAEVTETAPVLEAYGTLLLRRRPVSTLSAWTLDDVAQDVSTLTLVSAEEGEVRLPSLVGVTYRAVRALTRMPVAGTEESRITITYTGGYTLPTEDGLGVITPGTLPADVEEAAIITAVALFLSRTDNRRVASEKLGDYSVTYATANTAIGRGLAGLLPDEAALALAPYRRLESA